jgi:hypothetical protein
MSEAAEYLIGGSPSWISGAMYWLVPIAPPHEEGEEKGGEEGK